MNEWMNERTTMAHVTHTELESYNLRAKMTFNIDDI